MVRRLAIVAAALIVVGAVVVFLRSGTEPPPEPLGEDGFGARASFAPRAQIFGDTFTARLDVLIDPRKLDPDRIEVNAVFEPFEQAAPPRRTRDDYHGMTRLTYEYTLDCVQVICVPETERKNFGFREAIVRLGERRLGTVEWPIVSISSTLRDPTERDPTADPEWHATLAPLAPTYRVDPTLLVGLLVTFALALLATSVVLLGYAFPGTPLGLRLRRRRKLTPLQRALVVLERANERGIEEEQRLALDRLAGALRATGESELAGAAHELAWAARAPANDRAVELSHDVRELIAGRRNGRP